MKAIKVILVFLLCLLPHIVRSSSLEQASREGMTTAHNVTDYGSIKEDPKTVYAQVQYTPFTGEGTAIRQTQSVKVTPEINVEMGNYAAHVDSLIASLYVMTAYNNAKEVARESKSNKREATAYLWILPAITIISVIGAAAGFRLGDPNIEKGSLLLLVVVIAFTLHKIPVILTLF